MSLEEQTRHHPESGRYLHENTALSDAGQLSNAGGKTTAGQASDSSAAVDSFASPDEKNSDTTLGKDEREPRRGFKGSAFFLMAIGSLPRIARQRRKRAVAVQALLQLDDHLLRDIGLTRWTLTHL